jgi:hypothetical protein
MAVVLLKIDVSGTVGDEAWRGLQHFDQVESASFGSRFGRGTFKGANLVASGEDCSHPSGTPHASGEWIGAEIRLQTPLLAQYAVSHYLEQDRVLDADVVE